MAKVDDFNEQSTEKYAWFQIADIIFTAPHYLIDYMNAMLGYDSNRTYQWINNSSPHLYETRWRPDFCFVYLPISDVDSFDMSLRKDRIGRLQTNSKGNFQTFSKSHIDKLNSSPYIPELIGKTVRILKGPLDDFIGVVDSYSKEKKKYMIRVRLLVSEILYPQHKGEFVLLDELSDPEDNVSSLLSQVRKEVLKND